MSAGAEETGCIVESAWVELPAGSSATGPGFVGIGHLGLVWSEDLQSFHCDGLVFHHEGSTGTDASHDLAHLLIAANGNLPWCPVGADVDVRIAEYNAVFIEHLLDKIYNSVVYNSIRRTNVLNETLCHARWFVDEHFAPFPLSADEAYSRFCRDIEPTKISRLSPLFFDLKSRERTSPNYRQMGVKIQFSRDDVPAATGKAKEFSHAVSDLLEGISRWVILTESSKGNRSNSPL